MEKITLEMRQAVLKCLCNNYKQGERRYGQTEGFPDLLEAAGGSSKFLMTIMQTFSEQGYIDGDGVGSFNVLIFETTHKTHQVAIAANLDNE